MQKKDVIIIGAGAAGLMCAIEAGKRGRKVTVIEHANKPGKKILMSGGGRCNFTNYHISYDKYISNNKHFFKSALSRYTQWDFIGLVESYKIDYYEKTLGQLFCKNKARDIVNLLLAECEKYKVEVELYTKVNQVEYINSEHFKITTSNSTYHCQSLVIATGGLSIPTMGATGFGYEVAKQFDLKVLPTRAGLVPFVFSKKQQQKFAELAGVSLNAEVNCNNTYFKEGMLFTHKGLSGPSILQISSYWDCGDVVGLNLAPDLERAQDIKDYLLDNKKNFADKKLKTVLSNYLPKKIISLFLDKELSECSIKHLNTEQLDDVNNTFTSWKIKPAGTEGYRTAEVTLGGVDVNQISSKTMEANNIKGLFFIGEVLDVTAWLGGYNFQWAWSSGWVAGQYV